MQQMMELLLAKMDGRQEERLARMEAKMDANKKEMKEDNNKKFEVLKGTLFSQMYIHREKLEEAIQHRIEDVMTCVDHKIVESLQGTD
jgi:hypothetical protein